ncbi:hypothetical protein [Rhodococcus sp. PD04]|uniref:hypothetical protein n=1 Tax=Rhodococcus sp. PD04 TaxID=3109594 RepID=UPI002DDB8FA1|nr:hypothetical protein [Rhodococcus sp. PD04]WSE22337.1 hypothetical protein U9J23_22230 [Rhodococcus sp. PD04]
MTKREDGKEIVEERIFRGGREYQRDPETGRLVTGEYLDLIVGQLRDAIADRTAAAKLDPEVKKLAEELSVVHLPKHEVAGRQTAEPTRVEIYQSTRIAAYLYRRGWRFHPEHEQIRHVSTPDTDPAGDMGIHIERNEDGTWPIPDPEDFYDAERINVSQTPTGKWIASHPCGIYAEGKTKAVAHADVVQQLLQKIEEAHSNE